MGDCCNEELVQGSYGAILQQLNNILINVTQHLQSSWSHFQGNIQINTADSSTDHTLKNQFITLKVKVPPLPSAMSGLS